MFDILIVGGGPAGLTAAIYGARAGKSVLVLEKESIGGQIVYSPLVENYPGLPGVSGAELADRMYGQVEALGVEIASEEVLAAEKTVFGFRLTTDCGAHEGRSLILATGVRHRRLGLAGEEELVGCGVSYCAVCDGAFYAGKDVAVVGGGDTALGDALFLSNTCRSVTVLVRRDRLRGEQQKARQLDQRTNVTIRYNTVVDAFETAGGALTGLQVRDTVTGAVAPLAVEGVFLAVGQEPCAAAFAALTNQDGAGYLCAGPDAAAGVPGVFAAGDCRQKTVRQLTTAVGDGAAAALAACDWLDRGE